MTITKEDYNVLIKIAERAESMNLVGGSRVTFMLDIEHAMLEFDLRLNDLLNASDFEFAHDIVGIQNHINRETKQFKRCFVPRYSNR